MSIVNIRTALETAINTISPSIATAWENTDYKPVVGTPYQRVQLITAEPDNVEYGPSYQERGILQIQLYYPEKVGPSAIETRAEVIRTLFKRGTSFVKGSDTVVIQRTPEITQGYNENEFYVRTIRIRFYVNVTI